MVAPMTREPVPTFEGEDFIVRTLADFPECGGQLLVCDTEDGTMFALDGLWTPVPFLVGRRCSYADFNNDGVPDHRLWHALEVVDIDGNGVIDPARDGLLLRRAGAEVIQAGVALAVGVLPAMFRAGARRVRAGL